jgi:hypothetical protein
MLMVSTDGPLMLDRLEIEVSAKNQNLLSNSYRVPEEVSLPTTAAIVSNGDATAQAQITVIGWAGHVPLDRRDAIVSQIPTDRVVALHIVLSARCSEKLTVDADGKVESSCGEGSTCNNRGDCVPVEVSALDLPSYGAGDEDDVGVGGARNNGATELAGGQGGVGDAGSGTGASAGGSSVDVDACAGVTCESPPAAKCLDENQLEGYLPTGSCRDGECSYEPRTIDCDCDDDECSTDPCAFVTCEDSVCVLGTCEGVCAPPQTDCDGPVPRTCTVGGAWHDEPVAAGQCDATCTPGTTQCAGLTKQQTCDETGEWAAAVACQNQTCVGEGVGSACTGSCAQGQTQCSGAQQQVCTVAGEWGTAAACIAPRSCRGKACACPASAPEECNDNCTDYQTDKFNCGRCGHSCQGGLCTAGVCQPLTLFTGGNPANIAVSSSNVYWSSSTAQGVYSVPLNGLSTPFPSYTSFGGNCVMGLAVDATSIYGLSRDCSIGLSSVEALMKAPLAGGDAVRLETNSFGALPQQFWRCLAVGATNVYFSNFDTDEIFQVAIGGGPAISIWKRRNPLGVAVNSANVFWGTSDGLLTMPIAGASAATISSAPGGNFVAVDASYAYYTSAGSLLKTLIAGSTPIVLAADAAGPLVVDADNVYFLGATTVQAVPKLGGTPRTLASGQTELRDIAVDAKSVYWVTSSAVMKVAL